MNLLSRLVIFIIFIESSFASNATISSQIFENDFSDKKMISKYLKKLKHFSKVQCRPGVEEEFWKKYKVFKGNGNYIPVLPDNSLDKKTVNKFIPELKRKREWIFSQEKLLKKRKNFKKELKLINELEKK